MIRGRITFITTGWTNIDRVAVGGTMFVGAGGVGSDASGSGIRDVGSDASGGGIRDVGSNGARGGRTSEGPGFDDGRQGSKG